MHHKDPFPDFKTARSMLITEEMRLKSKSLSLPVDSSSSSPLALITDKGITRNPSNPQFKPWKPCIHFAKGTCRFGMGCKFVHDTNNKQMGQHLDQKGDTNTEEIILRLLGKLGITNTTYHQNNNIGNTSTPSGGPSAALTSPSPHPSAYFTSPSHLSTNRTPPGFSPPQAQFNPTPYYYQPTSVPPGFGPQQPPSMPTGTIHQPQTGPTAPPHAPTTIQTSHASSIGQPVTSGQETILPHAFAAGTLHDPSTA
ncbi:hypothetical protein CTI12_AA041490 [Artemisia annua]|uniref:C3H1-type domain-containing protein n=1 Tax=Artemisia annua TaxID=35608 RepID=A0A2U1PY44_ARTAN|nr:hypothetical protein CTI12_AA041490 [Artemisia annua]